MNSGSSLSKYVPRCDDWSSKKPWRAVKSLEGLHYIASSLLSKNPVYISHLRVRVNLGMSDASTARQNRIKRFFKALHASNDIQALDLAHCQLSDHTCRLHVATMLERNSSLTSLRLSNNAFTDEGATLCVQALPKTKITELNVSNNDLTREFIINNENVLKEDIFSSVNFSHTDIGAHGVMVIAGLLPKLKTLKSLNLTNVKAGNEGCDALSKAFDAGANTSVETLDLTENHIGRDSIILLTSYFVPGKNETVTSLNISKNYFGNEGFFGVIDMMNRNVTMKVLKCAKVGITVPQFNVFCEYLIPRYEQEFGPYPELEHLDVSGNGLGNPTEELFTMLSRKNCVISKLGYDSNEVDNFGCKLFKYFFCGVEYKSSGAMYKGRKVTEEEQPGDTAEIIEKRREVSLRRTEFSSLCLKDNRITGDGAEHLASLVKSYIHLKDLDIRKNNIGLSGAIFFKKAFRSMQCDKKNFDSEERTFTLNVMPDDVTLPGVNHLAIGIREHANTLKKHIISKKDSEYHKYERHPNLQKDWDKVLSEKYQFLQGEEEEFKKKHTTPETKEGEDAAEKTSAKLSKDKFANLFDRKIYRDPVRCHLGVTVSPMSEFDTSKKSIQIRGVNDEGDNLWVYITAATFTAHLIRVNERGVYKWISGVAGKVKKGWGSVLANQLYRWGLLIRLRYYAESEDYVRDLYLYRYARGNVKDAIMRMNQKNIKIESLISRMVIDDLKEFWEVLMPQTSSASDGLIHFELVLKHGKAPLIDVVRQFINVFPAAAYSHPKSNKPAVFLLQQVAHSGKTYRDLCLECEDKNVRRYAEAKKLVLYRFQVIDNIYISKFLTISKVEDLLLTEEYDEEDRFFYMRKIANTTAQKEENLSKNEFEAHRSFMKADGSYLPDEPISNLREGKVEYANPMDRVSNLILTKNLGLNVGFINQVSHLYHRKQLLNDDSLMPSFTLMYKTTLREVLDNESLAGGRDLKRAQIMLKMLASSLGHFNDRDWVNRTHKDKGYSLDPLATEARCHGNVKPRNIILKSASELPDLDKGDDFMPGKWVLSDFTRSTQHGNDYFPPSNSAYNPPEVAQRIMSSGESHLKKRVSASSAIDVWQFGCVLFEVLSGTSLFKMEGNNDLIVDEEERGELVNWVSLDEERSNLILNQLKSGKVYRNINHSLSLSYVETLSEEQVEAIVKSGKQLVQWCLQGDPDNRPGFAEILGHSFFANVNIGRKRVEKDADKIERLVKNNEHDSWDNEEFQAIQPHLHLINTEFEEASTVVKSIEETLNRAGCRVTTDSIKNVSPEEYDKQVKLHVQNARVVACLLTNDCFFKPKVVKQLLYGEDYRAKIEKGHSRVLFIDLTGRVDLSRSGLTWDKKKFSQQWRETNEFHYLVRTLADEKVSLSSFSVDTVNYDNPVDGWTDFLKTQFRTMVLSYMNDIVQYETVDYLRQPMVDKMLRDGNLVPTLKLNAFPVGVPSSKNFIDSQNLLNKKLEDRKDKFMNLYFLPSNKVKQGAVRTYVLSAKGQPEETFQAVSAIARALEKPGSNNLIDAASRHKEPTDPRNKLINKVKTSYNIRKDSHLKVGGRSRAIQAVKDSVLNITRIEGALLLVVYATKGVFKRYGKFIGEAFEKRGDDLALVLISAPGFKVTSIISEIEENIPSELQDRFKNPNAYMPYNKNIKKTWQYDAFMDTVQDVAVHALTTPLPRETFAS